MIIITILLYKYILLLVVYLHLRAVTNENDKSKRQEIRDKLQLYGDNVILLKLDNTSLINFILIIIYILA